MRACLLKILYNKIHRKSTMKLFIVATPIGNLSDITLRALETLKSVDFIICEDTRQSKRLLSNYNIKKELISFHKFSDKPRVQSIVERIKLGQTAALITDAGTPAVSDPGGYLVSQAIKSKIEIIPIPGASAITAGLSISGFDTDKFLFLGFLPRKKGRQKQIAELKNHKLPIIFYESPYRIKKTLAEFKNHLGDREAVVCRELTKKFETIYRGKISEILDIIKEKGEFTIIINKK